MMILYVYIMFAYRYVSIHILFFTNLCLSCSPTFYSPGNCIELRLPLGSPCSQ